MTAHRMAFLTVLRRWVAIKLAFALLFILFAPPSSRFWNLPSAARRMCPDSPAGGKQSSEVASGQIALGLLIFL